MKNFKIIASCILLGVVISSCNMQSSNRNGDKVVDNAKSIKRFFSDDSFWNQPIAENAEIDPNSEKWIKMLEQEPTGENFSTVFEHWTVPVYEADANTEYVQVNRYALSDKEKTFWVTVKERTHFEHGPDFSPVPIPEGARADIEADAHFAVVDWNRMVAWDMWGLYQLEDGTWESKTGMFYRLDGDGVFDGNKLGYIDDESVHFHGPSRAAGVPIIAGLIMYDEVMAGEIKHKLSCASRFAATKTYVYPATWTDGYVVGGIPEGAVIQLDPKLDLSQFDLTKEEVVIAKALQSYGMVVVDIAQGQPLYAEGLWGHPDKSWEGKLREWKKEGINTIPFKHYRILKVNNPVKRGDIRTSHPRFSDVWLPEPLRSNVREVLK